ncbi:MAG: phospholipid carrier-dependent glycosyltransferase [Nitrososphaera sp.]
MPAFLILVPLALCAYTHLWNPAGFPNLYYDEGVYMRRAMHVMEGLGPQEAYYYDHPFFGQLFLGTMLKLIGYPQLLNPSSTVDSIRLLYEVPRMLMAMLAVIDTFLIYKISERLYSRNVALLASILFAVMPSTWFTRMILLDSILLPFMLFSILLAVYTTKTKPEKNSRSNNNILLVLLSGVFLGTAIFTKIPAFTMIPLVAFFIYRNNGGSIKALGIWFIPVILIPLIWPVQSIVAGAFNSWTNDVLWQINRENAGLPWIVFLLAVTDPFIFVAGFAGLAYAFLRRDYFIILWSIPFMVFLAFMGYTNFFYWIPMQPALCIGAAKLIFDMIEKFKKTRHARLTAATLLSSIILLGLTSTTLLIVSDVSSAQFESTAYAVNYFEENRDNGQKDNLIVISNPVYSWIFKYVFDKQNVLSDYRDMLYSPVNTTRNNDFLIIDDPRFRLDMGNENSQLVQSLIASTNTIETFKGNVTNFDLGLYPYTSMIENYEGSEVSIKVNNNNNNKHS